MFYFNTDSPGTREIEEFWSVWIPKEIGLFWNVTLWSFLWVAVRAAAAEYHNKSQHAGVEGFTSAPYLFIYWFILSLQIDARLYLMSEPD